MLPRSLAPISLTVVELISIGFIAGIKAWLTPTVRSYRSPRPPCWPHPPRWAEISLEPAPEPARSDTPRAGGPAGRDAYQAQGVARAIQNSPAMTRRRGHRFRVIADRRRREPTALELDSGHLTPEQIPSQVPSQEPISGGGPGGFRRAAALPCRAVPAALPVIRVAPSESTTSRGP